MKEFMARLSSLRAALLAWYDSHGRTMPWRKKSPDPYHVWVSEVMLQQTTVAVVRSYFARFIACFPDIKSLATAPRDEVLLLWQGLGYYRRAHLLHEAAQQIMHRHDGRIPKDQKALASLAGIGAYTSAAICAIAFGTRAVVIDGNVMRVLSRLFAHAKVIDAHDKWLYGVAQRLTPHTDCAAYVQALMDLGATVCTPRAPRCEVCPWQKYCRGCALGRAEAFPYKKPKKSLVRRHAFFFVYRHKGGAFLMRRNPAKGLLGGTFILPSTPWRTAPWSYAKADWRAHAPCTKTAWSPVAGAVEHVFTHFALRGQILVGDAQSKQAQEEEVWVAPCAYENYPLSTLARRLLTHGLKS